MKLGKTVSLTDPNIDGFGYVQVMAPVYVKSITLKKLTFYTNSEVIVHAPFQINLCSEKTSLRGWSYRVLYELTEACIEAGVKNIVLHCGYNKVSEEHAKEVMLNRLTKWSLDFKGKDINLLIENTVASKTGTRMGSALFVLSIMSKVESKNIGICFDTTHAYADGDLGTFDPRIKAHLDIFKPYLKVIHLNSLPKEVEFGNSVDRHSNTSLKDSHSQEYLKEVSKWSIEQDVPIIFERKGVELSSMDREYMQEVLNEIK